MLKILDEKIRKTPEEIEEQYPGCKYLLTGLSGIENISGYLYCISNSIETYKEICDKRREINKNGGDSIVLGHYKEGGMVGVQYEIR